MKQRCMKPTHDSDGAFFLRSSRRYEMHFPMNLPGQAHFSHNDSTVSLFNVAPTLLCPHD